VSASSDLRDADELSGSASAQSPRGATRHDCSPRAEAPLPASTPASSDRQPPKPLKLQHAAQACRAAPHATAAAKQPQASKKLRLGPECGQQYQKWLPVFATQEVHVE
jgi:hypothetical protein